MNKNFGNMMNAPPKLNMPENLTSEMLQNFIDEE